MKFVLLIVLALLHLLYVPLNRQSTKHLFKLSLDDRIPLIPVSVWFYSIYYFLIPFSIALLWRSSHIIPFLVTQIFATTFASFIWWLIPNGVSRPILKKITGPTQKVLSYIYTHDKDSNGLPSGHVMHTFITCFYLSKEWPDYWPWFFLLLMTISFSTLTTKQHYFIDMVSTLILTPFIIEIISFYIIHI